jgi:hypothetical protein
MQHHVYRLDAVYVAVYHATCHHHDDPTDKLHRLSSWLQVVIQCAVLEGSRGLDSRSFEARARANAQRNVKPISMHARCRQPCALTFLHQQDLSLGHRAPWCNVAASLTEIS